MPTRTLVSAQTPPPPRWITDFAEPILEYIDGRTPGFQDDFSPVHDGWYYPLGHGSISLEEGVIRLKQGGYTTNIYIMQKANYVLQVDISRPTSCCTNINIQGDNSIYLGPSEWGISRPNEAGYSENNPSFSQKIQVTIIVKDSQAGFYLMGIPVFHFEDPDLAQAAWATPMLGCDGFCEFDNVKFWDIAKMPALP
jgi:hypothetical protein